jgi:6-phosphogluconolactonase
MSHTIVALDAERAAHEAARLLVELLRDRRDMTGAAHIALAGGNTPRPSYVELATLLADWSGIHVWFGDERLVPLDDPDANARLVFESLLARRPLPADRIHTVPTHLGAGPARDAYEAELRRHLPADNAGIPMLDIAFLGLGEDAHTASLFPDAPALSAAGACAVVEDAPKPPPVRITLTLPALAAARERVVLVTGAGKAHAVAAALGAPDPHYPASLLPRSGTTWILDAEAATSVPSLGGDHD